MSLGFKEADISANEEGFLIACFCAEWCGTCREYKDGFDSLKTTFPYATFMWVDVEEAPAWIDNFDVENFPTILIQRNELVVFYGVMLPHHSQLRRLIKSLEDMDLEQLYKQANESTERQAWQREKNLRMYLKD